MNSRFIMILILILVTNIYLVWRMYQILPVKWLKIAVPVLYVLSLATFILGFMGILRPGMDWTAELNSFLSPVLIIYMYSLMAFLIVDIGRLVRLVPKSFAVNSAPGSAAVFGVVAILLLIGSLNYNNKRRVTLDIETDKVLEQPLKIVMASDLHLGYTNGRKALAKWVDMINAENPDLILFGGDLIDVTTLPLFEDDFAEEFRRLNAPVYAVFGNHEFISGLSQSMEFYRDAGITVLRDASVRVKGITIVGRDDLYINHMASAISHITAISGRQDLGYLVKDISTEEYTILLDHQPYNLEEAETYEIDFQFSGHTHRGQVWPISLITDRMYEKSWGHHQRGQTQYYISSGLGIWGPKIRLGSQSEYLVLTLKSK